MKARLFLWLVLAGTGVSATAQATHVMHSAGQRSAPSLQFLGFALWQPPTLITCPTARDGLFDSRSWSPSLDSTCMESPTHTDASADGRAKTLPIHFSRAEEPQLAPGIHARGFALLILDGAVQGVLVRTSGRNSQRAIFAMLRKKYGVPTSVAKAHGQNNTERAAESISASWVFTDLRVRFEGIDATTGEGWLSLATTGASDYVKEAPSASFTPGQFPKE